MKYLNLSSLFVLIVLLSSCYSTEVFLRGSKVQELPHSEQNIETDTISITKSKKEGTSLIKTVISPSQEVFHSIIPSTTSVLENRNPIILQKSGNTPTVHASSKRVVIKHQSNHYLHHATTSKNFKPQPKGIFGAVGHSFGVVGVVFIFVGLILFLIGGLLIDTLGALFLGFGLVFLLIWLVLAVLQGLFDVIL